MGFVLWKITVTYKWPSGRVVTIEPDKNLFLVGWGPIFSDEGDWRRRVYSFCRYGMLIFQVGWGSAFWNMRVVWPEVVRSFFNKYHVRFKSWVALHSLRFLERKSSSPSMVCPHSEEHWRRCRRVAKCLLTFNACFLKVSSNTKDRWTLCLEVPENPDFGHLVNV